MLLLALHALLRYYARQSLSSKTAH
jgi:hypothetical protein